MRRRDAVGIAVVVLTAVALETFRQVWFEPRAIGLACLHGTGAALVCQTRTALGLLTYYDAMGSGALVLGIWAIAGAPFAVTVAAVCLGVAGLIDYNISWGMLGAVLGVWAWMRAPERNPSLPRRSPV